MTILMLPNHLFQHKTFCLLLCMCEGEDKDAGEASHLKHHDFQFIKAKYFLSCCAAW